MLLDTKLGETLKRVQKLNFGTIWLKVFSDKTLQRQVLNWIRQDQLFKEGIDEKGRIIGLYSIATESINPSKKAGTPYTLFDSGDFYRSFFIAVSKNDITIDADPIKTDGGVTENLFTKYGEGIIGLTDENKSKLSAVVMEKFNRELQRILL